MNKDDLEQAAQHPNVIAFLKAIRLGEGTSGEDGYQIIVGGGTFGAPPWIHPKQRVWLPRSRYEVFSTAAGAYQFLSRTWAEMADKYGLDDFSPENQDLAAIGLIARRGALDDVIDGRIEEAIGKCKLEWASLPGSPYGQRTEKMSEVLAVYTDSGGSLA